MANFCENAALVYGDRAFTVQAHPEFTGPFLKDLIEKRGRGLVPDPLLDGDMADGVAFNPLASGTTGFLFYDPASLPDDSSPCVMAPRIRHSPFVIGDDSDTNATLRGSAASGERPQPSQTSGRPDARLP